ncbi:hypothetical protein [Sphingorhabdus sp.]|uniref:hypothetical protein n=1 Tax=Sphingorhabdus sp. TaxID=1902408 RepID=UPI00391C8260
MQEYLLYLAERWIGCKIWLIEKVGLTNDAMHIHGSLMILFVSAMVLRRRPDSLWCWFIVFIAELFNEYADLRANAPGEATLDASLHDLYNTMFWPTVILILGRFLFPRKTPERQRVPAASRDLAHQPLEQATTV